jgi:hypothetical protein
MVPPVFPVPELLVTVTGVLQVLGALGLLIPRTAPWAAAGLALLMVALFPANVYAAREAMTIWRARGRPGGPPPLATADFIAALLASALRPGRFQRPVSPGRLTSHRIPAGSVRQVAWRRLPSRTFARRRVRSIRRRPPGDFPIRWLRPGTARAPEPAWAASSRTYGRASKRSGTSRCFAPPAHAAPRSSRLRQYPWVNHISQARRTRRSCSATWTNAHSQRPSSGATAARATSAKSGSSGTSRQTISVGRAG